MSANADDELGIFCTWYLEIIIFENRPMLPAGSFDIWCCQLYEFLISKIVKQSRYEYCIYIFCKNTNSDQQHHSLALLLL